MTETDFLMHHGILGQKWGVRRYQNKNGSMTIAGKSHRKTVDSYGRDYGERAKKALIKIKKNVSSKVQQQVAERQQEKEEEKKTHSELDYINSLKRKPTSALTDAELSYMTNRLRNEQNYAQLVAQLTPPAKRTAGTVVKEYMGKFANQLVSQAANETVKVGSDYLKKELGLDVDNDPVKVLEKEKNRTTYQNQISKNRLEQQTRENDYGWDSSSGRYTNLHPNSKPSNTPQSSNTSATAEASSQRSESASPRTSQASSSQNGSAPSIPQYTSRLTRNAPSVNSEVSATTNRRLVSGDASRIGRLRR